MIGMCVGTALELPYPVFIGLWAGFIGGWDWLVLVYLPRVSARRFALERAEDPSAAARQRRERIAAIVMIAGVTLSSLLSMGSMLRAVLPR